MDSQEAAKHWTLQPDSIVVPVAVDEADLEKINLTELTKKYGPYMTVTDYSDNTKRGTRSTAHWRIGCI